MKSKKLKVNEFEAHWIYVGLLLALRRDKEWKHGDPKRIGTLTQSGIEQIERCADKFHHAFD